MSRRIEGCLIDCLVFYLGLTLVLLIAMALAFFVQTDQMAVEAIITSFVAVAICGWFFGYTWMLGGKGTVGMRARGLRLVLSDGEPLGFGRAVLRTAVFWILLSVLCALSPLFDSTGRLQGWHDKAAGAFMVTRCPRPVR